MSRGHDPQLPFPSRETDQGREPYPERAVPNDGSVSSTRCSPVTRRRWVPIACWAGWERAAWGRSTSASRAAWSGNPSDPPS